MVTFGMVDEVRGWAERLGHEGAIACGAQWWPEVRQTTIAQFERDPLVVRFRAAQRPEQMPLRSPAMAIGEQRFLALCLALLADEAVLVPNVPDAERPLTIGSMIAGLRIASTFLWRNEVHHAAKATRPPPHIVSRSALPGPSMYWTFEGFIDGELPDGEHFDVASWLFQDIGDAFAVIALGSSKGGRPIAVNVARIAYGAPFPSEGAPEQCWPILSMLSFLNSPYIDSSPAAMARAERRELMRLRPHEPIPEVRVVQLRSRTLAHGTDDGDLRDGHEWRSRWLVRGHHRAQWYPSQQEHKVIWVAPYVKGPEGKPFQPKVYAVVR